MTEGNRYPRHGTDGRTEIRYLDESSSARASESSRRPDSRGCLVVETVDTFELGSSFGLVWHVVALDDQLQSPTRNLKTHIDPGSLLDMNFDMGLSGPTSSTADFAHTIDLTSSSLPLVIV